MESLKIRLEAVTQALKTLSESLNLIQNPEYKFLHSELRDSVIKRFEYSIDTFWKYIRDYLEQVSKVVIGPVISAKAVFRASLNIQLISQEEFELLLLAIDDRNLTSHTYNKELAEIMALRVKKYFKLMNLIIERTNYTCS